MVTEDTQLYLNPLETFMIKNRQLIVIERNRGKREGVNKSEKIS